MSHVDCFIGEIRIFGSNFAPRGWALCHGQLEAIANNEAMFSLLGTIFGGDGRRTFGFPDMRSRLPMHAGSGPSLSTRQMGQRFGTETVTLTAAEIPSHSHTWLASTANPSVDVIDGNMLATANTGEKMYEPTAAADKLTADPNPTGNTGGSQSHDNRMPALAIHFIIATTGIFPSRN